MLLFILLIIDLHFLILATNSQIFNPIAKFIIPIGIPNKEAKTEIKIHPVSVEATIRKCSMSVRLVQTFLCFLLINSFSFYSIYSWK